METEAGKQRNGLKMHRRALKQLKGQKTHKLAVSVHPGEESGQQKIKAAVSSRGLRIAIQDIARNAAIPAGTARARIAAQSAPRAVKNRARMITDEVIDTMALEGQDLTDTAKKKLFARVLKAEMAKL